MEWKKNFAGMEKKIKNQPKNAEWNFHQKTDGKQNFCKKKSKITEM